MTYDKMTDVERVARALREVEWGQVSSWDDTDESDREYWRKSATAAVAALTGGVTQADVGVAEALANAVEPLANLAGVNMNDPLRKWLTVGQIVDAKDALAMLRVSQDGGGDHFAGVGNMIGGDTKSTESER